MSELEMDSCIKFKDISDEVNHVLEDFIKLKEINPSSIKRIDFFDDLKLGYSYI